MPFIDILLQLVVPSSPGGRNIHIKIGGSNEIDLTKHILVKARQDHTVSYVQVASRQSTNQTHSWVIKRMQHAAVLPLVKSRKAQILQQNLEFTSSRQNPPFFSLFIISAPFSIIYPVFYCIFSTHFHTPLLFTPYNTTKIRTDLHITYYSLICRPLGVRFRYNFQ